VKSIEEDASRIMTSSVRT